MKTNPFLLLTLASALGAATALAQERPPQPPEDQPRPPERRPDAERPPSHPEGERSPGRPEGERGPGRPEGDRGPGRGEGRRPEHAEGERRFSFSENNPGSEGMPGRPQKPTPYLGVMTAEVPPPMASQLGLPEGFGLIVEEVVPESPAATGGVQRYDVLKLLNDQQLVDPNQLATLVRGLGKDHEATLTVLRKGQEQKLTLKIGERMLPDRQQTLFYKMLPGEFPHMNSFRENTEDIGRNIQEKMRAFQERMQDYQRKIEEWRKNPGNTQPPEPPKLDAPEGRGGPGGSPGRRPNPSGGPPAPGPSDLLREARPGGAPQVRVDQEGNVTTWNTGQARVVVKDDSGEFEVHSEDGKRTLTAKNPAGETIFSGPIDTEEQRRALPEPLQKKLAQMHVHSEAKPGGPGLPPEEGRHPQPPPARQIQ